MPTVGAAVYEAGPVSTDMSGNVYTAGTIEYTSVGDTCVFGAMKVTDTGNLTQLIITKSDSSGAFRWAFGTQGANVWLCNIRVENTGNVYVMGDYLNTSLRFGTTTLLNPLGGSYGSLMYFLAKLDSSGNVVWAKIFLPANSMHTLARQFNTAI